MFKYYISVDITGVSTVTFLNLELNIWYMFMYIICTVTLLINNF